MKKSLVCLHALAALALSSPVLAQQIPDFTANNANPTDPGTLGPPAPSYGYPDAPDIYSDERNMRFRKGLPSYQAELTTVPTFQSIGIYWAPPGGNVDRRSRVKYRKHGEQQWKNGLPLSFDPRNKEYRGSLVMLDAGTSYDIELSLADQPDLSAATTQATWSEQFPVGRTITLPPGVLKLPGESTSRTYEVNVSGTPDAYVRYVSAPFDADPSQRSTIDMGAADGHLHSGNSCVVIKASYVIVSKLQLKNCQRQGIAIDAPSHDVIIEDNDISGFGSAPVTTESPPTAGNVPTNKIVPGHYLEAGISCSNRLSAPADRVQRVVIQRNRIHDPRYGSIHWGYAHPNSANGIAFGHCGGNHVIRYNEVYAAAGHYFSDGIGGGDNFTFEGFPAADSDIHGNDVSGVYDDAIESEGANRNVRIWGNYLHHVFTGVGLATVSQGPVYAFRNILGDTVGMSNPNGADQDSEGHGVFFKLGSREPIVNGGRAYFFHNTNLQPPPLAGMRFGLGSNGFLANNGGDTCNIVSRNNLMSISDTGQGTVVVNEVCGKNDIDYDAYRGGISINGARSELHPAPGSGRNGSAIVFKAGSQVWPTIGLVEYGDYPNPQYKTGKVYLTTARPTNAGNYQLQAGSLGYGSGVYLPNFNEPGTGTPTDTGIDAGAHQRNTPPMEFGVDAYRPKP
ncbi:right-handed parallel beta-helix repeat-containing protein [Duganella sp. HH101]|uniref:right-handed parallel beta-helix repeat-containing protein n=1 Tax=Duganella sp. HH101 TaxID=1781066 RepID=UPI000874C29F|nr:right-handed parallel beta-helix repeat-containing protein [Duganella sp. HH101]OFA03260.1 hypothetical protein DUGA2_29860 [Duganella sp. HH101]